ncbi:hypothetical protein BTA51_04345 [Hahella sp. CCB-MM4]|uniref:hypothetical protein n=1 Tax=Hahella sp. (strain CCB-MM4) TaxID=1926491 RepID=UPI000B9C50A8|nr:hypothetical protein [Hahella sp. CCB-MM4]OZG74252.1 hypothetical protein BTA51_04345 [Hahella sp. CCB-MM4]
MSKLKSYQEQLQQAVEKGIKSFEEQHRALAAKPFDYAEKLEEEAKTFSVKSVREIHDKALDTVYTKLNEWNKLLNDYTSDLVSKFEPEEKKAPAKKKPAAKKAPAKTAAKAAEAAA